MPDPIDWRKLLSGGDEEGDGTTGPSVGEKWSAGISRGRIEQLQALQGVKVYDPINQMWGTFSTRVDRRTGKRVYWLSDPAGSGQAFNLGTSPTLIDPRDLRLYTFAPSGDYQSKIASQDDLERFGLSTTGGTGGTAPAYMSTQPAQAAQFQHDQDMANLNAQLAEAKAVNDQVRAKELEIEILGLQQTFQDEQRAASEEFQAEQNLLAEEGALKRERLGVLENLVSNFLQSQQRASEFVLQLQPDPFAFAAAAGGMPVLGTTPQGGYAQALTEFAGRPAPTIDPNASPESLQAAITTIRGQQTPLAPGLLGGSMSAGGAVPVGASGTFLVGEAGPEVMEVSPAGVTVKPLQGGFQFGGTVGFGDGVDYDPSTMLQMLAPLYTGLTSRLTGVPLARMGSGKQRGIFDKWGNPFAERGYDILESLGIRPSLVKFADSPMPYLRDPTTGALQAIPSQDIFNRSKFNWEDIVHYSPEMRSKFDFGSRLTSPVTAPIPGEISPLGPLSSRMPLSRPLEEGGNLRAILPAPYKIATQRSRMASVNPQLHESTQYAYGDPDYGLPFGALGTAEDIFTPRGRGRSPVGYW